MNISSTSNFRFSRHLTATVLSLFAFTGITVAQDSNLAPPSAPPATTAPATSQPQPIKPADLPEGKAVIEASFDSIGGKKNVSEVKSLAIKATLAGPMGTVEFDLKSARNGAFHLRQSMVNGPESTVCYDGKVGWVVRPDGGHDLVDEMTLEQGKQQFRLIFPYWTMFNPSDHFTTFETVDRAEFGGEQCYKVKLGEPDESGAQLFGHYGVEKKMMRGMSMTQDTPMGPINVDFAFGDWKTIGDLNVFTKLTIGQMGQKFDLQYSDVQFNTVDAAVFDQPAEVKELIKKKESPPATQPASPPATAPTDHGG